jgi:hypothetical protein
MIHSCFFLGRVRWVHYRQELLVSTNLALPSAEQERLLRARFREWGACVHRGGHERSHGQLDRILRDLGPCPSIDDPDAVCLWLAALLNPLPALGVAPEIRPHMLLARNWVERFGILQSAIDASLDKVRSPSTSAGAARDSGAVEQEIDVCRVS